MANDPSLPPALPLLRASILIIGSLYWDDEPPRPTWRNTRLDFDDRTVVSVPIRYARRAQKRGYTFTMTFADSAHHGSAVLIPCLHAPTTIGSLIEEARALWGAEIKDADTRAIGASWGTVGILFRNTVSALRAEWIQFFRQQQLAPVIPVDSDGLLNLAWPSTLEGEPVNVDLILATATRPSTGRPPIHPRIIRGTY